MAVLVEISPGVYRGTIQIPADAAPGTYQLRSTLTTPAGQAVFFGPRLVVEAPPPPPRPTPAPVTPPGPPEPGTTRLPGWAERVVDAFSWIVTAWAVAQVLMWFGLDNFVIAAAVAVALALLIPGFLRPAQLFFRAIILELVATLVELLEFIAEWLKGVLEYFQGNLVRAIIRILMVAAFMWIWNLAMGIPAVKQLFDTIVDTAGRITAWINDRVDWLLGQIERLRQLTRAWVDEALEKLGVIGAGIRDDILALVDRFFAGLRRELQELRFELLARVDVVRQLLAAEVEILGQRFKLIPDEVRRYLLGRFSAAAAEEEQRLRDAQAGIPPASMQRLAPWEVAESEYGEVQLAIAGIPEVSGAAEDEFERELRKLVPQAPAYLRGWLDEQITNGMRNIRAADVTTRAHVEGTIREFYSVLAGRPPAIPDLPPELLPPPRPAPQQPETP